MILHHQIKDLDQEFSTVSELGGHNLSTNKVVTLDLDITLILIGAPGNGTIGRGRFTLYAHRYGGANAIIDSQYEIIPLETPSNLAGASVTFSTSANRIIATLTPPSGRTVRAMCTTKITTAQD